MKPKTDVVRKHFDKYEDYCLNYYYYLYGPKWTMIASHMPGRSPRQCRERFKKYLSPNVNNSPWTYSEDMLLLHLINQFGNRWAQISVYFPGRTDSNIKNRWYKHLKHNNFQKTEFNESLFANSYQEDFESKTHDEIDITWGN